MNVFIVVRPSLCIEGSLESTLHDASRVAVLFCVHFAARLARRMIAVRTYKSTVRRHYVRGISRAIITIIAICLRSKNRKVDDAPQRETKKSYRKKFEISNVLRISLIIYVSSPFLNISFAMIRGDTLIVYCLLIADNCLHITLS